MRIAPIERSPNQAAAVVGNGVHRRPGDQDMDAERGGRRQQFSGVSLEGVGRRITGFGGGELVSAAVGRAHRQGPVVPVGNRSRIRPVAILISHSVIDAGARRGGPGGDVYWAVDRLAARSDAQRRDEELRRECVGEAVALVMHVILQGGIPVNRDRLRVSRPVAVVQPVIDGAGRLVRCQRENLGVAVSKAARRKDGACGIDIRIGGVFGSVALPRGQPIQNGIVGDQQARENRRVGRGRAAVLRAINLERLQVCAARGGDLGGGAQ